ncbi:MAG: biosynthetic-type acetolactate synthase large subunit [Veillonella sp. oral taxon 780]|uniref:biosynthetic-type acetolactate synthase large subunit n=1 Tax=Veillonella sp. CNR 79/14 TaxID=2490954 RepID=UPI000F8CA9D1|nr:biosynthetic-type acetolactate synthase large subunit [Veillonella sp. CNR 79/14]MBS6626557.1 biosynthetic-type acetolactate synthase large subunit [Veillonella sp. oral taxon 780]
MSEQKMIRGARILLETLKRLGVTDIFGYPGGAVIPIYNEIYDFEGINHYLARHEQGAAHEADGYARASGKCGVCLATSGPGATNLVTGIMTAHMDSIPLLAITGQVASHLLGKDAFQESDIIGITMPVTKNNYLVQDIRDIARTVKEAYYLATTGRPGPVLVDITRDAQLAEISYEEFEAIFNEPISLEGYDPNYIGHKKQIKKAIEIVKAAKRPLIIAGHGVLISGATEELYKLATTCQIPVTNTLLGLGSFPGEHQLSLGMLGMHGTVYANYATNEADVILALGIRFDDRIAGVPKEFCPQATIVHVDIDPAEIEKNKLIDVPIVGDLKHVLNEMNHELTPQTHEDWLERIREWREEYPIRVRPHEGESLLPQKVIQEIDNIVKGNAIVVTDVGQHQMWASQFITYSKPNTIITSGGAGTMGFGLPAAIGAQVAQPDTKVVLITGDGGLQMNSQELLLLKAYNIPVKVVIINNGFLGMVRQWQELFNNHRYSFVDLSISPDFEVLAQAYGVRGVTLSTIEDLRSQLRDLILSDEPVVINCIVEKEENVFPMIPAGCSAKDMIGLKGGPDNE